MSILPIRDVSGAATTYREYIDANTFWNAFEDYRLKREVSLNGVNLNTSRSKAPNMRVAEADVGPCNELMDTYLTANLHYRRWFRTGAETAHGSLDPETGPERLPDNSSGVDQRVHQPTRLRCCFNRRATDEIGRCRTAWWVSGTKTPRDWT